MRRLWTGGPTITRKLGRPAKLWWLGWDTGVTLVRTQEGAWLEIEQFPVDADLSAYSFVLRGGYEQIVPEDYYTELVAAGYGSYFTDLDEYTNTMLTEYED